MGRGGSLEDDLALSWPELAMEKVHGWRDEDGTEAPLILDGAAPFLT